MLGHTTSGAHVKGLGESDGEDIPCDDDGDLYLLPDEEELERLDEEEGLYC